MNTLSPRQRTILWHRAQGLSGPQIAHTMHLAVATISYHERIICHTLRATNITHAVHLGHLTHLIGSRPDCGDRAAYLRHLRRKERACTACKAANAEHAVAQRAGRLKEAA
ncbi:LuxR C-terminal-related transcriptional regulator [Streptomyces griseus]|uniref:LuxR C-terminal-related transcriptional regulator n=1 Tax=Streptomyces griseus TaxID=1911 RepID=UPI0033ECF74C